MGSIYYTSLFEVDFPRVGLLSNGTEKSKGNDVIRAAASTLSQLSSINYLGFVEGRDATADKVDVIVCDGFVGNVLLKVSEGCVRLIYEQLMIEAKSGVFSRIGLGFLKGALKQVFAHKFDYSAYGGSPLLGLTRLAFVLHGSSDSRAVKNAIRTAHIFAASGMTQKITQEMISLDELLTASGDGELFTDMFSGAPVIPGKDDQRSKDLLAQDAKKKEESNA
jgi:glycerol-3-phosphate acyltransferase PlsX